METRNYTKNWDHMNWWDPEQWKTRARATRSRTSVSLDGADPNDIRNGWLTLETGQAKYQQRQLQEREMKIASLYEAQQARALDRVRHSPSNGVSSSSINSSPPPPAPAVPHQPGKVRQMFEERRTRAGIDKSYPLQPIQNTERTRKPLTNGHAKVTTTTRTSEKKSTMKTNLSTTTKSVQRKQTQKTQSSIHGSGDLNHNHEPDLNSVKRNLPHNNGELIGMDDLDNDNNYMLENETFPEALAPTPTPRSPDAAEPKRPPRRTPTTKSSPQKIKSNSSPTSQPVAPPRRVISDNTVTESGKARGAMQRVINPVTRKGQPVVGGSSGAGGASKRGGVAGAGVAAPAASEGAACSVCGRRFAPDRLPTHEQICKRASTKKRKPFDALKHRVAGTEAEQYISKLRKPAKTTSSSTTKVNKSLNNNWRQKHEEFIQAIRAAKQVQQHLNAGGKLSDLPPPPPSENPDYVKCPHCGRRFNEQAAERHIPKCANFQFNKPKPGAQTSKKR